MTESRTLCVSNRRYFHRFRSKQIDMPLDLLAWLKSQGQLPKFYLHGRDGVEVAACGSALMLHSIPRFDEGNDSPAKFWGGHAFFPKQAPKDTVWKGFPRCGFFIPKIEIIRKGGRTTLIQHAINSPLGEEIDLIPSYFKGEKMSLKGDAHLPPKENWNALIEQALGHIREEIFQKVVMARRSTHDLEGNLDPLQQLAGIDSKAGIRFAVQFTEDSTFIGATPERLYLRKGLDLYTEAVAGTCRIDEPESMLLDSKKDRHEFDLVKDSIRQGLEPLCKELSCEEVDGIINTPKVRHLHNPFTGVLKQGVHDDEILAALHPTAAMGGLPKSSALEHLIEHEPFERGWYASPIGYISQDEADFCVGIRSALVGEEKMHLFAGAGIVDGSHPEKEWEELENKISLWKDQ